MEEKVTLASIAAYFKTSTTTISKALNGQKGVSDSLRKAIRQYADENHYAPNLYGRGLRGKTLQVLGVITADVENPAFVQLVQGIERTAAEHGYNIMLCNSDECWETEQRHINMLLQKGVDGIIIVPAACDDASAYAHRYRQYESLDIPIVFAFRSFDGCGFDIVKSDNQYGALLATRFLIQKGHRRILHVTTNLNISTRSERIAGYKEALAEAGLPFSEQDLFTVSHFSLDACARDFSKLVKKKDWDYTAVFAFNDILAIAMIKTLAEAGIRVPDEVAVIGVDDMIFSDTCLVPLTTVPQSSRELGRAAVQIILERITSDLGGQIIRQFRPAGVIERRSV